MPGFLRMFRPGLLEHFLKFAAFGRIQRLPCLASVFVPLKRTGLELTDHLTDGDLHVRCRVRFSPFAPGCLCILAASRRLRPGALKQ